MKNSYKATIYLMLAAILWGGTHVAIRAGVANFPIFYFSTIRSFIATITLTTIYLLVNKKVVITATPTPSEKRLNRSNLIKGSLVCGIFIFFGMNLLQISLVTIDAGRAGFITALYIVIVPIISIFFKHKMSILGWISSFIGVVGLYFLSVTSSFSIQSGDLIVLAGSFFFAFHILAIDFFVSKVDTTLLIAGQFLVTGILSLIVALFTETINMEAIIDTIIPLLYTGIISSGVCFTFQAMGQKYSGPSTTAVIMSTEALWAVIFGFIILDESLTSRELLGCTFMFSSFILSQAPNFRKKDVRL